MSLVFSAPARLHSLRVRGRAWGTAAIGKLVRQHLEQKVDALVLLGGGGCYG
jgi:hypothetical protein